MNWRAKQYGERWRIETSSDKVQWYFHGSRFTHEDALEYIAEEQRKIFARQAAILAAARASRNLSATTPLPTRKRRMT